MREKCVVDLGAHDGSDTRMYLAQGYYVFAIDANPELTDELRRTLPAEHCCVLNYALANEVAEREFYINHFSQWSSFNKAKGAQIAEWEIGKPVGLNRVMRVKTTTFDQLYQEHIAPKFSEVEYLKIDIEGQDLHVLKSLVNSICRPRFVSCELGTLEVLAAMRVLGYTRFSLANQHELSYKPVKISTADGRVIDYTLAYSTSGPFGNDLSCWVDFDAAAGAIAQLNRAAGYWYDLHGAL
jgi:FkbM family methyltransferase